MGLTGWCAALVCASVPAQTLADYEHTTWGVKDGTGGTVISVSETPSGMLVAQTALGGQVFDGVQFYPYRDRPAPFADHAQSRGQRSPTGSIYFFDLQAKGLARKWNGRTEAVEDKTDAPTGNKRFVFDQDGVGWVGGVNTLYRLEGLKVEVVGQSWGLPKDEVVNVTIDSAGTVWAGSADGAEGVLYYLPHGARRFERFATPVGCFPSAVAPDGSLWCASVRGVAVVTIAGGRPVSKRFVSHKPAWIIAFDSRGGFWTARRTGLSHLSDWRALLTPGGEDALDADTMTIKDGLSSDGIWSIQEDSAGAIWIGTGAGLDRFRATPFTQIKLNRRGWGAAVAADDDGSLWVGNYDRSLMHLSGGNLEDTAEILRVTAVRRGAGGRLWVAGESSGIWRKDPGGAFVRVERPSDSTMPQLHDIAEDDSGSAWFQASSDPLMRLQNGVWSTPDTPGTPPAGTRYFMLADAQGQVWFVGREKSLHVLKDGSFREIKSPAYEQAVGNAYVAYARGPRVWCGGARGLGAFVRDEFHPLKLTDSLSGSVTGIVETPEGDLWVHASTKAYRIGKEQVDAGLNGQTVTSEVFDFHDGLRAVTSENEPNPTLVQDALGRLWFSTTQGLFWIDPHAKRQPEAAAPETLLGAVKSDGQMIPAGTEVVLPPNPGQTEFSYAAAALGVGDRIHFRYRLDGIDKEWRDAGTRRTAYYTQLPPGRHRFEVVASNEQGRWAESPTVLNFEVRPAWYQTLWFRTVVVLLSLGLLLSVYRMRVRVVARRERSRVREIAAERERIARDLHDTLLQSVQGVILGIQGVAIRLPAHDEVRHAIEKRLDHADQLLGEARDRVRDLRGIGTGSTGLREAFELTAAELAGTVRVAVVAEGKPLLLRPQAHDLIYLIGREALLNAVTHGNCTDIEVRLRFTPRRLVLRVRDNGVGIDPIILAAGSRPAHYGLIGMRERAAQLGAKFTVAPAADAGTEVLLDVPASHAFEGAAAPGAWRWLLSIVKGGW